jgi:hypothetical protein
MENFYKKIWATFWAIFSQTHPVTLAINSKDNFNVSLKKLENGAFFVEIQNAK